MTSPRPDGRARPTWGQPTFLGRADHALAGWWHAPSDRVPADVVLIAPPIGRESVVSYRALRQLAALLAERGAAAVRFAWSGTGESAPLDEGLDAVENWRADLLALTEEVRALGAQRVHVIGLRSGGLVVEDVWRSAGPPWDSVLLWDPIPSGRWFVRYETTLLRGIPDVEIPDDGGFHAPGLGLAQRHRRAIAALAFRASVPPASSALVHRPSSDPEEILTTLDWADADRWVAYDQHQLLEVDSVLAKSPVPDLRRIAEWFELEAPTGASTEARGPSWQPRTTTVMTTTDGPVRETLVSVGPYGLPGIITAPLEGRPEKGVLFLGGASESKDGATALWTQVSRMVASRGRLGLRADRRGAGDAVEDFTRDESNPYRTEAREDVHDAALWLTDLTGRAPDAVGMCAGAYLALEPANAALFDQVIGFGMTAFMDVARLEEAMQVPENPDEALRAIVSGAAENTVRARFKHLLRSSMPYSAWRLLGRLSLVNSPDGLFMAASAKTDISLVFSPHDFAMLRRQRGLETLARCARAGRPIRVWVDPGFDHALLGPQSRTTAPDYVAFALFGGTAPREPFSPEEGHRG